MYASILFSFEIRCKFTINFDSYNYISLSQPLADDKGYPGDKVYGLWGD